MHLSNLDEVKDQLENEKEKNFVDRVKDNFAHVPGAIKNDVFDFRKINYLETSKRNLNFSYL